MVPVIVLRINAFIRLIIPAETWEMCNSDAMLPEHVEKACEMIAKAILQALTWSM